MAKRGRKITYGDDVAAALLDRLRSGEPLAEICRSEGMPSARLVSLWKETRDGFAAEFARARDEGFDAIAADCLSIADTVLEGVETVVKDDGRTEERRGDMLGHRKLRIETRLKLLAKWDPRRYGEKLAVGGAEDLPPIDSKTTVVLTAEEAYKRMLGGG